MSNPMQQVMSDVIDFHRTHNIPMRATPGIPDDERVRLRARLLVEELGELLAAMFDEHRAPDDDSLTMAEIVDCLQGAIDEAPTRVDLVGVADALADIQYVTIGAALEFGLPHERVWQEVCRSNRSKAGAVKRADGKITKPQGYSPPNIRAILYPDASNFPDRPAAMVPAIPDEPMPYSLVDNPNDPGRFFADGGK